MSQHTLVPGPDRLEALSLITERGVIILQARTGGATARCPICGHTSSRVHSRYRRTLRDLPWQNVPALFSGHDASSALPLSAHAASSLSGSLALPPRTPGTRIACVTGCDRSPSRWAASQGRACCVTSASRSAVIRCWPGSVRIRLLHDPHRVCSVWTTSLSVEGAPASRARRLVCVPSPHVARSLVAGERPFVCLSCFYEPVQARAELGFF